MTFQEIIFSLQRFWSDRGCLIHQPWDVEVGATDDYEVVLYYTCPKADIGSTVELSFNGEVLTAKITEPHDPPLTGMEHDRFERIGEQRD